jgi:hypothetical protein
MKKSSNLKIIGSRGLLPPPRSVCVWGQHYSPEARLLELRGNGVVVGVRLNTRPRGGALAILARIFIKNKINKNEIRLCFNFYVLEGRCEQLGVCAVAFRWFI